MLTHQELKLKLNYDSNTGYFTKIIFHKKLGVIKSIYSRHNNEGYIPIRINDKLYKGHRLAWFYVHGVWPKEQIDHINGERDDNRIANLRECNNSQNSQNQRLPRIHNTSGYLGVSWNKKACKFYANIRINGKLKFLGSFDSAELAHNEYLKHKREHHKFCTI